MKAILVLLITLSYLFSFSQSLEVRLYIDTECKICKRISFDMGQMFDYWKESPVTFNLIFDNKANHRLVRRFCHNFKMFKHVKIVHDKDNNFAKEDSVFVHPTVVIRDENKIKLYYGKFDDRAVDLRYFRNDNHTVYPDKILHDYFELKTHTYTFNLPVGCIFR